MDRRVLVLLSLLTLFFVSCGCGSKKGDVEESKEKRVEFVLPEPPTMLSEEGQVDYLAKNFWRNFDFADTAYLSNPEMIRNIFMGYVDILHTVPKDKAVEYMTTFWDSAQADRQIYDHLVELGEDYLYDPNSPYRNEELYVTMLNSVIGSEQLSDIEKLRAKEHLKQAKKNRVGTKAANFKLTFANGSSQNLYDIKADYTLLYFINPGCAGCAEYSEGIARSQILDAVIVGGQMKVVLLYPDSDLTAWKEDLDRVPKQWLYGYDKDLSIRDKGLYELRAIPTLYLLDKDKKVLVKDAKGVEEVEHYIYYNASK